MECIGHVQKRMGTGIRKLKTKQSGTKLSDGKTLSGKNRLAQVAINKIQTYYDLAIRRNTHSVEAMKQAVWASYYHIMSSDEKPYHQLCPKGETWCKYNESIAENKPYNHKDHFHLPEPDLKK